MSTGTPKATEICVALTSKADHDSAPHSLYDEHSDAAHGNCFWFPWGGVFVLATAFAFALIDALLTDGHATAQR